MKTLRLFLLLSIVATCYSAQAQRSVKKSFLNINGVNHDLIDNSPNYDFQNSPFGRFNSSGNLPVTYIQVETGMAPSGQNNCLPNLNYRVYRTSDTPGAFIPIALDWAGNLPTPGDQRWEKSVSLNLVSLASEPGTYVVEMYISVGGNNAGTTGCDDIIYDSNYGENYRAYFEYENTDSFTDGDFSSPTWTGNTANFTIINNSVAAGLNGSEPTRTRTVRLNSTGAANEINYISTEIADWGAKQEWLFWVGRNTLALSASNQMMVWLYADEADVTSPTVNGYRLIMGGSGGVVRFEKVAGNIPTELTSSVQSIPSGLTDYGIMFRVTRSSLGVWNVYSTHLPQNSAEASASPNALGASEALINQHLIANLVDEVSPISIDNNGHFAFMAKSSAVTAALTAAEFDNFTFKAMPADTYFTFSAASSSIAENAGGNIAIAVEIHNPSTTNATSVDVVLISGDANRTTPVYTTTNVTWVANDAATKYITIDPTDNNLCDDNANLVFELLNPAGGNNATVAGQSTHTLTIVDDNMGSDELVNEDFELALPAAWVSTPAGHWSRSNDNAVGGVGYSIKHNSIVGAGSSSIALSLNSMPLSGVNTTWRFQVRFQQNPNANTHWLTFLSANTTDLTNISAVSGYAVGVDRNVTGGANDPVCLFKVTNGVYTVLVNSGLDWLNNIGTSEAVSFEVALTESGQWTLRLDQDGGFDGLVSVGSANDLQHPIMAAFGTIFTFTSGSSEHFKIDDISIQQSGCRNVWYSQAGGNHDASIWWNQTSGGNATVNSGRFDRFVIQNGHNVTTSNLWVAEDMGIETGATLTATNNTDLRLFGDWFNDGVFNRSTSNVTFRGTENQMITGSSITHFHKLTIDNDGGVVMVVPTDSMFVHNVAAINKGTFNMNGKVAIFSDATESGSIGEIKPGASAVGNVTLMRYIPSIPYQYGNWVNVGNPLTGLTVAAWNASIITTGYPGSQYPPPYSFINIRSYDEAIGIGVNDGYVNVNNSTNTLFSEKGYFVWLNGSAQNLRAKGQIQQGSFNHSLTYNSSGGPSADGWHLMTNPYPSEIDWNRVSSAFTGGNPRAFYVFDYQANSYKFWLATGDETGSGTGSRYIPHSQSFLVKVNDGGQHLKYQENYKTNNGVAFERNMGDDENSYFAIQLKRNGMLDENLLFFDDNAHANYDAKDVLHLASPNSNSIQMSCLAGDNVGLVQDSRPYGADVFIPMTVKMPEAGTYNLVIAEVGNLPTGACLYVEDMVTGQTMLLTEGAEMQVTINAPFEGVRFRITGSAPAKVLTTDATCFGAANGSIDVTVPSSTWSVKLNDEESAFEYLSNGSVTIDGLRAGSYQLEVVNPEATCTAEIKTFIIEEPKEISSAITSTESVLCNEGLSGSVAWTVNNTEWFSFEIKDESNQTVRNAEVEGTSYLAENLESGLYTIKVYTECGTHTMVADLRDNNAPMIAVSAPQTVALGNEPASVWLDAAVANAQSVSWILSNGQTGEGEMFEAIVDAEGVYSYTATAKGSNCDKTFTGSFKVKSKTIGTDANSAAITMLQQPEQIVITFGNDQKGKASVRIMDAAGKMVINKDMNSTEGQTVVLNTSSFSNGIYTVQIIQGSDVLFTEKVFRK